MWLTHTSLFNLLRNNCATFAYADKHIHGLPSIWKDRCTQAKLMLQKHMTASTETLFVHLAKALIQLLLWIYCKSLSTRGTVWIYNIIYAKTQNLIISNFQNYIKGVMRYTSVYFFPKLCFAKRTVRKCLVNIWI